MCQIYDIISLENGFTNRHKNRIYKIAFDFDCNSQCVIYLTTCKTYQNQYVGSIITPLRKHRHNSLLCFWFTFCATKFIFTITWDMFWNMKSFIFFYSFIPSMILKIIFCLFETHFPLKKPLKGLQFSLHQSVLTKNG